MCSEESIAALSSMRSIVNGMEFDADKLGEAGSRISSLQRDLAFDGALRQSVESLQAQIASARSSLNEHGDFAEDLDLSGVDALASAQDNLDAAKRDVLRHLDGGDEWCRPR